MALYYWLGNTGNGNVNLAANWTLWPPQSATGGTAGSPPNPSSNIPKYGDSISFVKYNVVGPTGNAVVYPIFGPSGQLNGLCGPAGATALQWLSSITVDDNCPVPLGTTAVYFKVRASTIQLFTGTNSAVGYGPQYPTYLDLVSGSGATKASASINIWAKRDYPYYIKGEASRVFVTNSDSQASRARIYLYDLSLTNVGTAINDYTVPLNSYDTFYVGPTTTVVAGNIYLEGKGSSLYIEKGFSLNQLETQMLILHGNGGNQGPNVYFVAEGQTGASGPGTTSRSYLYNLWMDSASKQYPKVDVNHGTDIVNLTQIGGCINFQQTPTTDSSIVQRGTFNAVYSRIYSPYGMVTIGANGYLTIENGAGVAPEIILVGPSQYYTNPYDGYSGGYGA